MPKLTILPLGQTIEVSEDQNILDILRERELYIKSGCGGHASCSDCIVKIVSGEDNINTPPFEELQLLGNVFHITKERLACQVTMTGDVTIDISMHDKSEDEKKMKKKNHSFIKRRTKSQVEEIEKEREEKREEKRARRDGEPWKNHWDENEGEESQEMKTVRKYDGEEVEVPVAKRRKSRGGGGRPKRFNTEGLEEKIEADLEEQRNKPQRNMDRPSRGPKRDFKNPKGEFKKPEGGPKKGRRSFRDKKKED